jgi:hypothetical protein
MGSIVRDHWAVENSLHWVMDMVFRDDECRVRTDHAPANFTTIKHIALNLIRRPKARIRCVSGARSLLGTTSSSQASSPHDSFTRFPWPSLGAGVTGSGVCDMSRRGSKPRGADYSIPIPAESAERKRNPGFA